MQGLLVSSRWRGKEEGGGVTRREREREIGEREERGRERRSDNVRRFVDVRDGMDVRMWWWWW